MYSGDSFFTLSMAGRVGLVCLSAVLVVAIFALARFAFRYVEGVPPVKRLLARIGIAAGLFWAFVWLSPQVYYLYYQAILGGLPWQVVIGPPPALGTIVEQLGFAASDTLSDHSKGVLGWGLLAYAVLGLATKRN